VSDADFVTLVFCFAFICCWFADDYSKDYICLWQYTSDASTYLFCFIESCVYLWLLSWLTATEKKCGLTLVESSNTFTQIKTNIYDK